LTSGINITVVVATFPSKLTWKKYTNQIKEKEFCENELFLKKFTAFFMECHKSVSNVKA